jgi:hypothetical protein
MDSPRTLLREEATDSVSAAVIRVLSKSLGLFSPLNRWHAEDVRPVSLLRFLMLLHGWTDSTIAEEIVLAH